MVSLSGIADMSINDGIWFQLLSYITELERGNKDLKNKIVINILLDMYVPVHVREPEHPI